MESRIETASTASSAACGSANAPLARCTSTFQWNRGGWLGGQFGCSAWILLAGLSLIPSDLISAFICVGSFAALNWVGASLWRQRDRISAYAGIQYFLLAVSIVYALVIMTIQVRLHGTIDSLGQSTTMSWWVIGMAPGMMALFALREWLFVRSMQNREEEGLSSQR